MLIELAALIGTALALAVGPNLGRRLSRRLDKALRAVARRGRLAGAAVAALAVAACLGLTLGIGVPVPSSHDEFAYLLGSDTFAHGRLTNPTHPLWEHFQSFHIIHQPTYQMKYPPAQSLALAVGQICGHPILGVWLSLAAACGAVWWMLRAWLPPRWALLGGLLPLLNVRLLAWWGESYWGGALAMAGGALLLGAARRIPQSCSIRNSLWLTLGLALLANTRPWEGLLTASIVFAG
ncbi:MAG: hypothetical protein MUE50_26105, partial [Pirellulaceae bacterium]|nr:hypothetical protein [Pirellulaceae bacterium]